ncbi:MAG: nuclear transport factor 2 family protein [Hyphomicrobiaceae bacterium]
MSNSSPVMSERAAISKTVQHYINGIRSGRGDDMKPAFHEDATIFGYGGAGLFAGPIQRLFDVNDDTGPSSDLEAQITRIDVVDTVATVRLELSGLAGSRYTDMFTLLKVDGEWKIMNKVFHLHA